MAKIEWHPGELYPQVGFIVTNLAQSVEGIVAFYNRHGTCEQYIKEGKNAVKWTRLSYRTFAANAVRLQLQALTYNLGNFMRTLAMPKTVERWSMTSLRVKLIKIGLLAIFDDHAASRNRRPSRSRPARPYMVRFSILRRLIWPSTGPLLQPSVTAARTAS